VFEADGFAQLTPEQTLWPVDPPFPDADEPLVVPPGYDAVCEEVVPGDPRHGVRWSARPRTIPQAARKSPMADPVVRHFLLCHHVRYDPGVPRAPYSIENVLFRHRLGEDEAFPLVLDEVWLFARIEGTGTREFWVDVKPYPGAGGADAQATYGPYRVNLGPRKTGLSRAWCLRGVPFQESGLYTFRFLLDGRPLATQPVLLED
jgi:hypothetical protein